MLNINYGHNRELMEKCSRLEEYALFVSEVRKFITESEGSLAESITRAIDECLKKEILKDVLIKQRAEVLDVILEKYDKELYEKEIKEEAYIGRLKEKIKIKLLKGKSIEEIADELEEKVEIIQKLLQEIELEKQ